MNDVDKLCLIFIGCALITLIEARRKKKSVARTPYKAIMLNQMQINVEADHRFGWLFVVAALGVQIWAGSLGYGFN